eukprot:5194258-Amphidinium_carterae.1
MINVCRSSVACDSACMPREDRGLGVARPSLSKTAFNMATPTHSKVHRKAEVICDEVGVLSGLDTLPSVRMVRWAWTASWTSG